MYTILIVDDEKLAREDISYNVGKSGFPFTWIMEAASGEEALEIIKANRPDILFTDIMMGAKSGLDLLEEARKIHPEMVTVIICGYPDFKFAQRAVAVGVTKYLLKPVKKDEIKEVLSQCTQEVRLKREQKTISKKQYLLEKSLEEHRLQEDINAFVTSGGRDGKSALKSWCSNIDYAWCRMMLIHIGREELGGKGEMKGGDILLYGVRNIIEELFHGKALVANSIEHENVVLALVLSGANEKKNALAETGKYAAMAKAGIDKAFGIHTAVALSGIYNELVPQIYTEATLALDMRFSLQDKAKVGVLNYTDYAENLDRGYQEESLSLLKRFLNLNDIYKAKTIVAEMIGSFAGKPDIGIRNVYMGIISAVSVKCYKNGISILPILGSENISGSILNTFSTLQEISENLQNIMQSRLGDMADGKESTKEIMQKVKEYIDETYTTSDLSTNKLSDSFCISLGYLSASYKKEHGITISKYIIAKRITYAEKLLAETDLSVGDIAESSGFNNLSYFMRLFKGQHRITPSQYRSRVRQAG